MGKRLFVKFVHTILQITRIFTSVTGTVSNTVMDTFVTGEVRANGNLLI